MYRLNATVMRFCTLQCAKSVVRLLVRSRARAPLGEMMPFSAKNTPSRRYTNYDAIFVANDSRDIYFFGMPFISIHSFIHSFDVLIIRYVSGKKRGKNQCCDWTQHRDMCSYVVNSSYASAVAAVVVICEALNVCMCFCFCWNSIFVCCRCDLIRWFRRKEISWIS